jgi:hypothetical protein
LDGVPADMRKNGGKSKIKMDGHGIYLDENGNKISIDINGIQIIEGNEDQKENSASSKTLDSLRRKMKIEQMRMRDSLQKAKEKIQQQIEKIAISKTSPEALSGYYLQPYFLLVNNMD